MPLFADFIAPLTPEQFFAAHWPDTPYVGPGRELPDELLRAAPELIDAERVLESFGNTVSLIRRNGPHARVPRGKDALPMYRAGFTCYMRHVERDFAGLDDLIAAASRQLGLPSSAMSCEIFCSTGTSGVPMHSDFDVNFALLLSGSKRWRLAPNESIENQTAMCFARGRKQADERQLTYAHAPFPERMPDDAREIVMEAGGLLFLPRGWWHETYATGPCMQLNLVVKGPHWARVFSRALEEKLLGAPDWREFAYGVAVGNDAGHQAAVERLAGLIEGLQESLGGAQPQALAAELISSFRADSGSVRSDSPN
ncbi:MULTISPECIES: cupin domain-containing protein [unclassified Streptomyces]|uniref:JmjC domain-containing protein n=1 Tax=unclassified Streptomyces TaxID=2593676 RepID=UPI00236719C4|nr:MULTISPECIES: cupin domain-containing protein [unclassified Streptomyces]MDF3142778.1 cupin domain-containing protein [Streptomyces sp. T21Q-yed]WDF42875.1 cupin domain-containing protein [Streptomyces sp. T12]